MRNEKIAVPTTEEVCKLLELSMSDRIIPMKTIGELLWLKWVDSLLPEWENEPAWGYEGLRLFFHEHGINSQDTFQEALEKLK